MTDIESEILTLEEVAVYLKAGKRTVYRLAQSGNIPAFKLGGRGVSGVLNWIAGLPPASAQQSPREGNDATTADAASKPVRRMAADTPRGGFLADEVKAQRNEIIGMLETQLQQQVEERMLFTIEWELK